MNPEITKIIEQYLNNELSEADRLLFEQKLAENDQLLNELILQRQVHEAAKRASQRTLVQQTAKRYHFRQQAITTAIIAVIAIAVTAFSLWITTKTTTEEQQQSEAALQELVNKLDQQLPMENVPAEYFHLATADTVVLSESGVLLSVPETAFFLNGKAYSGPKTIQWQEAIDATTIIKGGLNTQSGNRLLETQGMFGMQAFTPEGKPLEVNPKVGVYIQVPVDELKAGMQLFEGKKTTNGMIDWQNPQPLEKLPMQADMSDLDFYPQGYETKLNEVKWKTGKKDRDSLYLSFEEVETYNLAEPKVSGSQSNEINKVFSSNKKQADVKPNDSDGNRRTQLENVLKKATNQANFQIASTNIELPEDKIKWNFSIEQNGCEATIIARVTMARSWHINSIFLPRGTFGYATKMQLNGSQNYTPRGAVIEPTPIRKHDDEADEDLSYHEGTVVFKQKIRIQSATDFILRGKYAFQTCDESHCLAPYDSEFSIKVKGCATADSIPTSFCGIPPSKVLAFWKPKFNKTILATRDFEKRMTAIHSTCNEKVLKLYTNNLNKPLHEIDAQAANMGYSAFNAFAAERVGALKLDNAHMNNLRQFYNHAIATLRKEVKKDRNFIRKQEMAWDNQLNKARTNETRYTTKRNASNYSEEYDLNYANAAKQLGFKKKTIGFTIRNNGNVKQNPNAVNTYNIDAFVANVTSTRTTGTFTDLEARKQATITYNEFSVSVENNQQFSKVMIYLFPHELNSFQRVDLTDGSFNYPLNNDIVYDMAIIGINEEGYYLFEKTAFNKGKLGTVSLEKISEADFNKRITGLNANRQDKPMKIADELDWLVKEQANYKIQRLRIEQQAFRDQLRSIVFPCVGGAMPISNEEWSPAIDEIEPESPEIQI